MLVAEKTIDEIVDRLEDHPEFFEELLEKYGSEQEDVFVFFASDNFKLLTDEENDLLIFFTLVILASTEEHTPLEEVKIETLEKTEEQAWDIFDKQKANFRDKLNPFFEQTQEEDLLAFVEDGLIIEEDNPVTAVGREIIFITLFALIKTIIPA